ncbi:hypothetical protein [Achromobacter anxifer]|uniref:hypothetical protein n=1 Tax=Achromobacter anxifer TaxID=1287737 RepID=UPI0015841945|nr:hypothetical protein [Achromobacter anxifer]
MSKAIEAGEIPHDIQHDVISQAVLAATEAARLAADGDALKAARAVAEAGALAWLVLNGFTPASPSPSVRDSSRTLP